MTGISPVHGFYIAFKSGLSPALRKRRSNRAFPFVPILCLYSGLAEVLPAWPDSRSSHAKWKPHSLFTTSRT